MFYNTNTTTAINASDYLPLTNRYELIGWDCWNKAIKKQNEPTFDHQTKPIKKTSEPTFDYIKKKEDNKMKKGIKSDKVKGGKIDYSALDVKKIIHSANATIVFWKDNSKTVVKLQDGDIYDEYSAFTAALAKKLYRSNSRIKKLLREKTVENKKEDKK